MSTPAMLEEMKVALAADIVDGISPWLNELMTVVWGNLSMISLDLRNGKDPTYSLDQAQEACGRIRDFLHQLSLLSPRIDVDNLKAIEPGEFVMEFANRTAVSSRISIVVELGPDPPPIAGDELLLDRLLSALVRNAEEAMPDGGTICIRVGRVNQNQTVISVEDTGVGIAPKHLPKVFEPFFSTKKRGRGLGLAGVRAAAMKMRGEVFISSRMGKGTKAGIILPVSGPAIPSSPHGQA